MLGLMERLVSAPNTNSNARMVKSLQQQGCIGSHAVVKAFMATDRGYFMGEVRASIHHWGTCVNGCAWSALVLSRVPHAPIQPTRYSLQNVYTPIVQPR